MTRPVLVKQAFMNWMTWSKWGSLNNSQARETDEKINRIFK